MSSPIAKSVKDSYNKTSLPTPSPSSLSSTSTSSTLSSSSILFASKKNSYKSVSSPSSPVSLSPTSNKNDTKNDDTIDIISKLSNKAIFNGTKILKQPISNTTKSNQSDSKQKNHKPIKINIKDIFSHDSSLQTPTDDNDSTKSQVKSKVVASLKDKYSNTYKLAPYIVTDVDLNNIDFELNISKAKSNASNGKFLILLFIIL